MCDVGELSEVFGAAFGDGVGEAGAGSLFEGDTFDLHEAGSVGSAEVEVNAAVVSVADFSADERVAGQLGELLSLNGFGDQAVGQCGVDHDPCAVCFYELEAPGELAGGLGVEGEHDIGSGRATAGHGTGGGDVCGDGVSVFWLDLHEEALIASDQDARSEGWLELHRHSLSGGERFYLSHAQHPRWLERVN